MSSITANAALTAAMATNSRPAAILPHLSPQSLQAVASLLDEKASYESVYFFPISFLSLMFILYLLANLLHKVVLPRAIGRKWNKEINGEHRRTMVVYVLQVVITSIVLVMQLICSPLLATHFTMTRINMMRCSASLIAALYLFEVVYRYRMTYPMIAHHMITCFAISLSFVMLERLRDPSFALTGMLWYYQATTEQTVFVALFLYRLSAPVRVLRPMFRVAAVQSIVFKIASIAGTVWVWNTYQRGAKGGNATAWDVLFWVSTAGLVFCQIYWAWVVWKMGESLEKRYAQKQQKQGEQVEEEEVRPVRPALVVRGSDETRVPTPDSSRNPSAIYSRSYDLEKGGSEYFEADEISKA